MRVIVAILQKKKKIAHRCSWAFYVLDPKLILMVVIPMPGFHQLINKYLGLLRVIAFIKTLPGFMMMTPGFSIAMTAHPRGKALSHAPNTFY